MRHRQALLVIRSRQLPVAGIARTDRNCSGSGAIRSRRSGVVGHRSPARAAAMHDHESTRLAYALPERVPSTSWSSSFPSPCWVRAERRGPEPPRGQQIETRPPGRWGNARRSTAPAPQSKPVTPPRASWRRSRRRWHSGLGRESWPQGQLVADTTPIAGVYVNQTSKARSDSSAGADSG